jgi:hypothetical protein
LTSLVLDSPVRLSSFTATSRSSDRTARVSFRRILPIPVSTAVYLAPTAGGANWDLTEIRQMTLGVRPQTEVEQRRKSKFNVFWRISLPRAAINVILPLGVSVFTAIAAVEHGPVRAYWCIAAFTCLALAGVINYAKDRSLTAVRNAAIQSNTDSATALNNTAGPIVAALGDVAATETVDDAKREIAVLLDRSVSLAQSEFGRSSNSKTRAVFYTLDGTKLERRTYRGWTGCEAPRNDFIGGRSAHDDAAIYIASHEDTKLVKDLENHPPENFIDAKGRPYKCFIAVPVRAGKWSFGLLTADSDQPYSLGEVERGFLVVIAGALAAGMAHVRALEARP